MKVTINLKLIKSLRETSCRSISDVAAYLGYKTPTSWWLIESGQRNMSIAVLYKISQLFNLPMEKLLITKEMEDDNNEINS